MSNTVPSICHMFNEVQKKCGILPAEEVSYSSKLDHLSESRSRRKDITLDEIIDVIFYLVDTSFSLLSLVTIVPTVCHVLHQHEFILKVASIIENIFPWIEDKLRTSKVNELRAKLKLASKNFLLVCHSIMRECILEPLHRR